MSGRRGAGAGSPAPTTSKLHVPDDLTELRALVDRYLWHHQIDLGNGIITPGGDKSARKLAALKLPPLQGKTVLDVGACDGYFSFAAERMGAERVVALDSVVWQKRSKDPFEIARRRLQSNVEDVELEVLDISPETVGMFDVVLFLGVLYHMRDPMAALEAVASVTKDLLVVETLADMTWSPRKAVAFYPGNYLGGDHSNWWGPNQAAAVAMIEEFGFKEVQIVRKATISHRLQMTARNIASIAYSRRPNAPARLPFGFIATDRVVIHARR
jgi:tRNA (mo5U34)-methyltransferase